VSCAIDGRINPDQWLHQDAARAAIREVAAWIKRRQEDDYGVVIPDVREVIDWLEREAKR
jgi:hypothetical protein